MGVGLTAAGEGKWMGAGANLGSDWRSARRREGPRAARASSLRIRGYKLSWRSCCGKLVVLQYMCWNPAGVPWVPGACRPATRFTSSETPEPSEIPKLTTSPSKRNGYSHEYHRRNGSAVQALQLRGGSGFELLYADVLVRPGAEEGQCYGGL